MTRTKANMIWLGADGPDEGLDPQKVGSKAALIARMARLGLNTPPAFALPVALCARANAGAGHIREEVREALEAGLARLEVVTGRRFADPRQPLLVSIRSGAAKSMPGMLSTVLDVGLTSASVRGLIQLSGDPRLAWDCYRRFLESYATVVGEAPAEPFAHALADLARQEGARDEADLDGEALERLTAAYRDLASDHMRRPLPAEPLDQAVDAILAVFRSWTAPKAVEYRRLNGLEALEGTAVTAQAMVFGNAGARSGSGVAFSRDPAAGARAPYVDVLFNAQGEDVVSGRRTPLSAAALETRLPKVAHALYAGLDKLEREFRDVQDVEFTIEASELYFLQTRTAKRSPLAAARIAVDLAEEGLITRAEAVERTRPLDLSTLTAKTFDAELTGAVAGIAAGPGLACGRAAFDLDQAREWTAKGEPVIFIRQEPATDDVEGFHIAAGILTAAGGRTSHAAVVARQMGKPCVVGCAGLTIGPDGRKGRLGGTTVCAGEFLCLDGDRGLAAPGHRDILTAQADPAAQTLAIWREELG